MKGASFMFINKFTTGLIAGSILGAAGLAVMGNDKKTRRRIMKDGRKIMAKANDLVQDITDIVK